MRNKNETLWKTTVCTSPDLLSDYWDGWCRIKKDTHCTVINFFKDGKLYAALCNPIDYRIDGHFALQKRAKIPFKGKDSFLEIRLNQF